MSAPLIARRAVHIAFILTGLMVPLSVAASEDAGNQIETVIFAGVFDIANDGRPFEAGLEIRKATRARGLQVALGLTATEESSAWVYGGARYEFAISSDWFVAPGLAVALYERGDGKDLGQTLQFRSSLEAGRRVSERLRVGLAVYHLSNASMSEVNPGSNSLIVSFAFRR